MTAIKFCGLSRICDIEMVNELRPEYIGFVFARESRRYVTVAKAAELKKRLDPRIKAVGVFVNEPPEIIAGLLNRNIIETAQLHSCEDESCIKRLRKLTDRPIIQAFRIETIHDMKKAEQSPADHILLDSGAGTGTIFDWTLIHNINRPYFLAGGLSPANVKHALQTLHPYAVDVSSGIETNGYKDKNKMAAFVAAVRKETQI